MERISLSLSLSDSVIKLARRAIARANPHADERERALIFVDVHYGRGLAERLREYLAT